MTSQGRLDFTGLDSKTSDFDLLIEPTEEFKIAVRPPPHPVTGSIAARAGTFVERVIHEPVRRLGRLVEVTQGNARAADQRLAGDPNRQKLHSSVDHVDSHALQRLANGDIDGVTAGTRAGLVDRRRDGGFAGAVCVKKTNLRANMPAPC